MKRTLLSLVLCSFAAGLSAQSLSVPFTPSGKKIASLPEKRTISDKSTQSYFIDYEAYDFFLNGNDDNKIQRSISDVLFNRTDSFNLTQAYVAFDSLILTTDYSDFIPYGSNEFTNMVIDSIYVVLWHGKASPVTDSNIVEVSIVQLNGGRPTDNVLTTQIKKWATSYSQPATASGYPLSTVAFGFNYSLPAGQNNSFGVRFQFKGSPQDTVYLLYSWPSTGNQCGSFTGVKDIVKASVYPNSFYRVYLGASGTTAANIFPRTDGSFVWYLDCNGNGTPFFGANVSTGWDPNENIYQHWAIWARVILTSTASVADAGEKGLAFRLVPNPAGETAQVSLNLSRGGAYTLLVRDLSGKTVLNQNLGMLGSGHVQLPVDLSGLQAGFYTMTVEGNGLNATHAFIRQ